MFIVTTKVAIKPGKFPEVLNLFKETNPELVKDQEDWIKAVFTANNENSTVKVHAYWKNKDSYLSFSSSDAFRETMARFGKYFSEKPKVEIHEVLVEM